MSKESGSSSSAKSAMQGLEQIRANVPTKMRARVGVLGSHAERQGDVLNNAEIGIQNELGSISKNIPPRSWLRMPLESRVGEIARFASNPKIIEMILSGNAIKAFKLIGIKAEEIIQKAFDTSGFGTWKPNAPLTIALKGSSKPLIDTSAFRRSVSSEVVNGD